MPTTCIIIPCYNEEKRLQIQVFQAFAAQFPKQFSLLFVNDGSNDNTLRVLQEMKALFPENIFVLNLEKNGGKAEAVRQGALYSQQLSKYDYIAYFDADLATPLTEATNMFNLLEGKPELKMVLASRWKRLGAKIARKRYRHILGRVFATFASITLRLPVYDTQCGAKLMKSDIVSKVFQEPFITKWMFDVEILARIRNLYPKEIEQLLYEHPLSQWEDIGGSKLKLKHMIKVPFEFLKIHNKYNQAEKVSASNS